MRRGASRVTAAEAQNTPSASLFVAVACERTPLLEVALSKNEEKKRTKRDGIRSLLAPIPGTISLSLVDTPLTRPLILSHPRLSSPSWATLRKDQPLFSSSLTHRDIMSPSGNGTPGPNPGSHPSTTPRKTAAATDCPSAGSPDPEQTSHSRHRHQNLAEPPLEDPGEEPSQLLCGINKDEQVELDDFLPCLDMCAASVSVAPSSEVYDADLDDPAHEGPPDETSGNTPLTSAAFAALPDDTHVFDIHGWIESLGLDDLSGAEASDTWGHSELACVDAGELVAMGGWCADETRGYPAVLRAEDVLTDEGMSGWVKVIRDEG